MTVTRDELRGIRRGDILWVRFDSDDPFTLTANRHCVEIEKVRPAVVVSNDQLNALVDEVIVVPSSTLRAWQHRGEVYVPSAEGLQERDILLVCSQMRSVDRYVRVMSVTGRKLSETRMAKLEAALRFTLGIPEASP